MLGVVYVFLGGGLGAVARYGLSAWLGGFSPARKLLGELTPIGTLGVNLIGCLLIGLIGGALVASETERPTARLLLVVGVLGGFTTFSSFAFEIVDLVQQRRVGVALGYVLASNVLGILAAAGGWGMASALVGTTGGSR
ncbi:MAG: fluoride efflux transporter CrcB [Planctomycetota bacterium]